MIKITFLGKIENDLKKIIKNKFQLKIEKIVVDKVKDIKNGDFFTNAAMIVASKVKKPINDVSNIIMDELKKNSLFDNVTLVKGFINLFLSDKAKFDVIKLASLEQKKYGTFERKKVYYNIEYVSANPTGSLHIGHARNAALGMTLNNVFTKCGIKVDTEYYINDGGSQINKLGLSVFVRYLQEIGVDAKMCDDWYQGPEPILVAKEIATKHKDKYKEYEYDNEKILNKRVFNFFRDYSKKRLMEIIKKDLADLRTSFKIFFPESKIYNDGLVDETIKKLGKNVFLKDGATWLRTTDYGDDKDRVIVKSNKDLTYFMPDIAYHNIKLSRGYDKIFNIFGADHNAYVTSLKAAIGCLGHDKDKLNVIVMQMVKLTKDGKEFKMSKRSGQSLTLRDLLDTMGVDSARWSLVSQASDTHLEIDVDAFTSKSHDNHLFYVLYTYARINKILQKSKKLNLKESKKANKLTLNSERELINTIYYYPHTIENVSKHYEVHKIPTFLYNLATIFNSYYNEIKILDDDDNERKSQRLMLLSAIKATLHSGLDLLNIKPKNKI